MDEESKSGLRHLPRLTLIAVLIAALYAALVFYSRWNSANEFRKAVAAAEIERARKDVELNGGAQLKILALYANPIAVRRGEAAQLCYGVANAKDVAFDPPLPDVWPARVRCVDVTPRKTTTYTLIAADAAGHKETAQVVVQVK
jgi:hypothetical protein